MQTGIDQRRAGNESLTRSAGKQDPRITFLCQIKGILSPLETGLENAERILGKTFGACRTREMVDLINLKIRWERLGYILSAIVQSMSALR